MNHKITRLCLLIYLLITVGANATPREDFARQFRIMPQPQKVDLLAGKGIAYNALRSVYLKGSAVKPVVYGDLKSLPYATAPGAGVLVLNLTNAAKNDSTSEGYSIEIKNNQVVITAASQAGLFYGCTTLWQLLQDAHAQQIEIPACSITDYPKIAYRAIHLDLKHHLDATGYYYDVIDRLAQVKVNAIII